MKCLRWSNFFWAPVYVDKFFIEIFMKVYFYVYLNDSILISKIKLIFYVYILDIWIIFAYKFWIYKNSSWTTSKTNKKWKISKLYFILKIATNSNKVYFFIYREYYLCKITDVLNRIIFCILFCEFIFYLPDIKLYKIISM